MLCHPETAHSSSSSSSSSSLTSCTPHTTLLGSFCLKAAHALLMQRGPGSAENSRDSHSYRVRDLSGSSIMQSSFMTMCPLYASHNASMGSCALCSPGCRHACKRLWHRVQEVLGTHLLVVIVLLFRLFLLLLGRLLGRCLGLLGCCCSALTGASTLLICCLLLLIPGLQLTASLVSKP